MIMKKYVNLYLILFTFLYSCQSTDVDSLFDQLPEQRVSAEVEQMKKDLIGSAYGWTAYYQYNNMRNENYFNIHFKEDGQAVIDYPKADGTVGTSTTTYTIRYSQQIDLIFDTYSILADIVGTSGGDFRFEFNRLDNGKIYFNTRNDDTEGAGVLELAKTTNETDYPDLVALRAKMVDNPSKSFYRVLTLDNGQKYLMNVLSLQLAWFEWVENKEIRREKRKLAMTDDGFVLETPFQAGDVSVKRFVIKEDDTFEAWDETAKVGVLDYGMKPFSYPNTLPLLLEESGDQVFSADQYSVTFSDLVDKLRVKDPLFTGFQFYLFVGRPYSPLAYYRRNASGDARWIMYAIQYGYYEDGISMEYYGDYEGAADYFPTAQETLLEFHQVYYTVIPRDGAFYLVQDQNPAIWMIVEGI